MNAVKTFVDTNILLYAFTSTEPDKQKVALEHLSSCIPTISTQVIKEFTHVLLKKTDFDLRYIKDVISDIVSVSDVASEELSHIIEALDLRERYGYSFYDCLIIATALSLNCAVLLSEDMQNGQMVENRLLITNPFLH